MARGEPVDRCRAAAASGCPADVLAALAVDADDQVRSVALQNRALPRRVKHAVIEIGLRPDATQRAASGLVWLLQNPTLSQALLSRVAAHVMVHPNQPQPKAAQLARMLKAILRHPNCGREWLALGVTGWGPLYQSCVAQNPKVPADLVAELLRSGSKFARAELAGNRAVPLWALLHLVDAETEGSVLLALMLRAPDRGLVAERLAAGLGRVGSLRTVSEETYCRVLVAEFSCDPGQVAKLCWDADPQVRKKAGLNPVASDADRVAVALR